MSRTNWLDRLGQHVETTMKLPKNADFTRIYENITLSSGRFQYRGLDEDLLVTLNPLYESFTIDEDLMIEMIDLKNLTQYSSGVMMTLLMIRSNMLATEIKEVLELEVTVRTVQSWVRKLKSLFPVITQEVIVGI